MRMVSCHSTTSQTVTGCSWKICKIQRQVWLRWWRNTPHQSSWQRHTCNQMPKLIQRVTVQTRVIRHGSITLMRTPCTSMPRTMLLTVIWRLKSWMMILVRHCLVYNSQWWNWRTNNWQPCKSKSMLVCCQSQWRTSRLTCRRWALKMRRCSMVRLATRERLSSATWRQVRRTTLWKSQHQRVTWLTQRYKRFLLTA